MKFKEKLAGMQDNLYDEGFLGNYLNYLITVVYVFFLISAQAIPLWNRHVFSRFTSSVRVCGWVLLRFPDMKRRPDAADRLYSGTRPRAAEPGSD
jgi:hypothetical protein